MASMVITRFSYITFPDVNEAVVATRGSMAVHWRKSRCGGSDMVENSDVFDRVCFMDALHCAKHVSVSVLTWHT